MRLVLGITGVFLFFLGVAELMAAGAPFAVRSPSSGLFEKPNAAQHQHTLILGQIVTVVQKQGKWFRIITEEGAEGWIKEANVVAVTAESSEEESQISESSPDDITTREYYEFVVQERGGNIRREARLKAHIVRTAKGGEILEVVEEQGNWFQVALEGKVQGWMHRNVGVKRESQDLALRLLDLVEGKLGFYDRFKNNAPAFRRRGWFPSFFLRDPASDLLVELDPQAGKAATLHISYARRDIEHRVITNAVEKFYLPEADRVFLFDLLLSVLDFSKEFSRARIYLWFATLAPGGEMSWEAKGTLALSAAAAESIPREKGVTALLWTALDEDTLPAAVWTSP